MGRAKRPAVAQRPARQFAGDGLDHRDVEQLARPQRRQDGGQALGQHRLAGAGRADEENRRPSLVGDDRRALYADSVEKSDWAGHAG